MLPCTPGPGYIRLSLLVQIVNDEPGHGRTSAHKFSYFRPC